VFGSVVNQIVVGYTFSTPDERRDDRNSSETEVRQWKSGEELQGTKEIVVVTTNAISPRQLVIAECYNGIWMQMQMQMEEKGVSRL
jgi:hypothetical protein